MISRVIKHLVVAAALLLVAAPPALAQFAAQATFAGTSTGSANAYVLSVPNAGALDDIKGVPIRWLPNFTNSGAATVTINGLTPLAIQKPSASGPVALTGSEIVTGSPAQGVEGFYNGTNFILTSNLNAVAASLVLTPQGYLTPCNFANSPAVTGCTAGVLTPTGDVVSATILYYQPAVGNEIIIWNGAAFVPYQFTQAQLTLTLGSSNLANGIYDVCVYSNAGTPAIGTSVAWSTATAGAGARGSGAGTAEITRIQGVWVNAVSTTVRNGASSTVVAANQCTVVASLLIDGTNGQVSFYRTYGQNRKWAAWNFYNRLPIYLKMGDPSASWTIGGTAGYVSTHADANNRVLLFAGLAEEAFDIKYMQIFNTGAGGGVPAIGIGWNVTNAPSGMAGQISGAYSTISAWYIAPPQLGLNVANAIYAPSGGGIAAAYGQEVGMMFGVWWRG